MLPLLDGQGCCHCGFCNCGQPCHQSSKDNGNVSLRLLSELGSLLTCRGIKFEVESCLIFGHKCDIPCILGVSSFLSKAVMEACSTDTVAQVQLRTTQGIEVQTTEAALTLRSCNRQKPPQLGLDPNPTLQIDPWALSLA